MTAPEPIVQPAQIDGDGLTTLPPGIGHNNPQNRAQAVSADRVKTNYIGSPAALLLDQAVMIVHKAFPGAWGIYQVGSSLQRPDWRDVDLRLMLPDDRFHALFGHPDRAQHNALWSLICAAVSRQLSEATGLPIDFQIQDTNVANHRYSGVREPVGIWIDHAPREASDVR